ncbi:hypothetical protein, partial [Enterococcus faecalis]|uniref:hypothetical protein n=1 Tax=Enterococcus faecalis TaxID=1351 RepID=UPI003D6AF7C2
QAFLSLLFFFSLSFFFLSFLLSLFFFISFFFLSLFSAWIPSDVDLGQTAGYHGSDGPSLQTRALFTTQTIREF